VRRFAGPWPQTCARVQLYLLEIFAARPQPSAVHIRFAKSLVTPEALRRDAAGLRDALVHRLGADRVRCEAVDDADSHEVRLEWTRTPAA